MTGVRDNYSTDLVSKWGDFLRVQEYYFITQFGDTYNGRHNKALKQEAFTAVSVALEDQKISVGCHFSPIALCEEKMNASVYTINKDSNLVRIFFA